MISLVQGRAGSIGGRLGWGWKQVGRWVDLRLGRNDS